MRIVGARALVCGGASGLGAATARRLHASGAEVTIADVDAERGEALARELGARFARCDVTDAAQVDNPVTVTGRDVLGGVATSFDTRVASVRPLADLELRKSAPASVAAGADVPFTLIVVNHGPSTARGVTIRDELPQGMTFRSAEGDCSHSAGVVTCAVGTLPSGASAAVTVIAAAPAGGEVVGQACCLRAR